MAIDYPPHDASELDHAESSDGWISRRRVLTHCAVAVVGSGAAALLGGSPAPAAQAGAAAVQPPSP